MLRRRPWSAWFSRYCGYRRFERLPLSDPFSLFVSLLLLAAWVPPAAIPSIPGAMNHPLSEDGLTVSGQATFTDHFSGLSGNMRHLQCSIFFLVADSRVPETAKLNRSWTSGR